MAALIAMLTLAYLVTTALAKVETYGSAPKKMYRT